MAPMESIPMSVRLPLLPGTKVWWYSSSAAKQTVRRKPVPSRVRKPIRWEKQENRGSCRERASKKYSVMWAAFRTNRWMNSARSYKSSLERVAGRIGANSSTRNRLMRKLKDPELSPSWAENPKIRKSRARDGTKDSSFNKIFFGVLFFFIKSFLSVYALIKEQNTISIKVICGINPTSLDSILQMSNNYYVTVYLCLINSNNYTIVRKEMQTIDGQGKRNLIQ